MPDQRSMLIDIKTGERRPAIPGTPALSSDGSPWRGILLEQHGGMPAEIRDMAAAEHIVITQIGKPALLFTQSMVTDKSPLRRR